MTIVAAVGCDGPCHMGDQFNVHDLLVDENDESGNFKKPSEDLRRQTRGKFMECWLGPNGENSHYGTLWLFGCEGPLELREYLERNLAWKSFSLNDATLRLFDLEPKQAIFASRKGINKYARTISNNDTKI